MSTQAWLTTVGLSLALTTAAKGQLATPAFDPTATVAEVPPAPTGSVVIDNGRTIAGYSSFYATPASTGGLSMPGYVAPYSYYAAPMGVPPRTYVGLGEPDAFPFHGQPYGYPYDRWTWPYMTGFPPQSLVRYYYPPLP